MYDVADVIHIILLVHTVYCFDFQVQLMSFDVQLMGDHNEKGGNSIHLRAFDDSKEEPNLRAFEDTLQKNNGYGFNLRTIDSKEAVKEVLTKQTRHTFVVTKKKTTKPKPDCEYQYPEKKQMEFILSNMMNELTQVFVKANDWLKEKITRRTSKFHNADAIRRALETRFNITHRKRRDFFEDIYHNMTNDYRSFYNFTVQRVLRSAVTDPCQHQTEIKNLWHDLLERSMETLKKAIRTCIEENLSDQNILLESSLGTRVNNYLVKEMTLIRTNQLKLICDKFELCYDEILKDFRWKANLRSDEFRRTPPYIV